MKYTILGLIGVLINLGFSMMLGVHTGWILISGAVLSFICVNIGLRLVDRAFRR